MSFQILIQACVVGPIGTKRSLSPLPVTLIKPSSKNKSEILSSISSLTRKPQLYKVSIIALLRSPRLIPLYCVFVVWRGSTAHLTQGVEISLKCVIPRDGQRELKQWSSWLIKRCCNVLLKKLQLLKNGSVAIQTQSAPQQKGL